MPAVGGVLDGIAQDVGDHLLQALAVAADLRHVFRQGTGEGMAVTASLHGIGPADVLHALPEGEGGETHFGVPGVQPAERQQVLDDAGHTVGLADDDVQEAVFHLSGDVSLGGAEGLRVAADVGEGGAQLMGDVGHELFAPLLVAVLLRHVVQDDEHASLLLTVGEGGQVELQHPIPHHLLGLRVVRAAEGEDLLHGIEAAEKLVIAAVLPQGPSQHGNGGGVPVNELPGAVKGHHAVGHVEEKGIQLGALILHGGQSLLQDRGHLVEGPGEDADLVGGFHGEAAVKVTGGHLLRPCRQLLDGPHHGLGEEEAQKQGDEQPDDQGLHNDHKELGVKARHGLLAVQNVDDELRIPLRDGDGHVHEVCRDVALVAHPAVLGGQEVGGGIQTAPLVRAQQQRAAAVQNVVVPGAVVHAQGTGPDLHQLLQALGSPLLGLRAEGGIEIRPRPEDAVHLLVEGVDIEAGDAGGEECAHHRHQGCDEQQQYQRQLHMETAEHTLASFGAKVGVPRGCGDGSLCGYFAK